MTALELADIIGDKMYEYIEEKHLYGSPVLAIRREEGEIVIRILDAKDIKKKDEQKLYDPSDLCIKDEFRMERINFEAINHIVQEWIK